MDIWDFCSTRKRLNRPIRPFLQRFRGRTLSTRSNSKFPGEYDYLFILIKISIFINEGQKQKQNQKQKQRASV